ncbi:hypothetical protein MMC17_009810 [Xylographa soralifera]|nr:hypothetical protein [Xylographa soralifera]
MDDITAMSSKDSDDDIWRDAVVRYEKVTGRKLKQDSVFSKLRSLDEFGKEVDHLTEVFTEFRNEHGRFYSALRKCIKPLERITDLAQTAVGSSPYAPAAVVFGAAKYLIGTCDTVSAAYDGLEALFKEIGDITERLQSTKVDRMDSLLRKKMTDILAFILEIIGKSEACIKRRRFRQWGRAVFLKDDNIQESITKLERYVQSEVGLVIHLTYGRIGDVQDGMKHLQVRVSNMTTGVDTIKDLLLDNRQSTSSEADEKILSNSLAVEAASIVKRRHDENLETLTKNTGLWIRDEPLFRAWQEEKAPLLWIFGKPGTGKTYLATKTVDMLHQMHPPQPDCTCLTSVSYFYIKDDNPNLQDLTQLLKTVALQITEVNDRFKRFAISVVKEKNIVSSKPATSLAFIIIDGLDEAPEKARIQFISCLTSLVAGTEANRRCRVQIAIFARPGIQADPGFDHVGFQSRKEVIEVTSKKTEQDIAAFIQYRLRDINVLRTLHARRTPEAAKEFKSLAKQITNSIRKKSQGMFKWAGLAFGQIWRLQSPEAIISALNGAPQGLEEMIHHTLKRLQLEASTRVAYIRNLLLLVFCAFQPLYIAEIWVLLLLMLDEHCYKIEHDLQGRYASLFELLGVIDQERIVVRDEEPKTEESASFFDDLNALSDDEADAAKYDEVLQDIGIQALASRPTTKASMVTMMTSSLSGPQSP